MMAWVSWGICITLRVKHLGAVLLCHFFEFWHNCGLAGLESRRHFDHHWPLLFYLGALLLCEVFELGNQACLAWVHESSPIMNVNSHSTRLNMNMTLHVRVEALDFGYTVPWHWAHYTAKTSVHYTQNLRTLYHKNMGKLYPQENMLENTLKIWHLNSLQALGNFHHVALTILLKRCLLGAMFKPKLSGHTWGPSSLSSWSAQDNTCQTKALEEYLESHRLTNINNSPSMSKHIAYLRETRITKLICRYTCKYRHTKTICPRSYLPHTIHESIELVWIYIYIYIYIYLCIYI